MKNAMSLFAALRTTPSGCDSVKGSIAAVVALTLRRVSSEKIIQSILFGPQEQWNS